MTDTYKIPPGYATLTLDVQLPDGGHFIVEVPNLRIPELDFEVTDHDEDLMADDLVVSRNAKKTLHLEIDGELSQIPNDNLFTFSHISEDKS